ncbi:MAG: sterol desaturase family protein [Actinomycetota bacterium]
MGKAKGVLGRLDLIDRLTLPLFAATMVLEHRALKKRVRRELDDIDAPIPVESSDPRPDPLVPLGYEAKDTASSLGLLAGSIVVGFAMDAVLGKVNRRLFRHRLTDWGARGFTFWKAMIIWDFLYYWNHRWMHEVRLFWGNHVAHHSGRRYNLSTALRQPWSPFLMSWIYFPMPLLGIPLKATAKAAQLNLLYQYWIHTEAIDRLPDPIEKVFNTPSHHRVHHGANPQYLDKNYAGILILWDRMFGTFEPEVRRVRYGITKNIRFANPVKVAYHEMADIAHDVRRSDNWSDRLHYVFDRPGWEPVSSKPTPSPEPAVA